MKLACLNPSSAFILVLSRVTACHITAQDSQYSSYALDLHVADFRSLAGINKELDGALFICQELKPICDYWMLGKGSSGSVVYSTLAHDLLACAFF